MTSVIARYGIESMAPEGLTDSTSGGEFPKPYPVQPQGSRLAAWVLGALRWKLRFDGLPAQQGVLVVYPHTSNWDFVVLILAKWALGVQASFWGKDSLFRIPLFGRWLRWMGGVPVDRSASCGVVGQMVDLLRERQARNGYFWLALSPEGTRRAQPGWRSGFYRIAVQARVPLGLVRADFGRREIAAVDFLWLSGDEQQDMARIAAVYEGVQGYRPEQAAPVRLMGNNAGQQQSEST